MRAGPAALEAPVIEIGEKQREFNGRWSGAPSSLFFLRRMVSPLPSGSYGVRPTAMGPVRLAMS